jgi:hypothetical protein
LSSRKKNLNFDVPAPYLGFMTAREAAYATLIEPLAPADVARDLGVGTDLIREEIRKGNFQALDDGRIAGAELARYLSSQRQTLSGPRD